MFIFNIHVAFLFRKQTNGFPGMSVGSDDFTALFRFSH